MSSTKVLITLDSSGNAQVNNPSVSFNADGQKKQVVWKGTNCDWIITFSGLSPFPKSCYFGKVGVEVPSGEVTTTEEHRVNSKVQEKNQEIDSGQTKPEDVKPGDDLGENVIMDSDRRGVRDYDYTITATRNDQTVSHDPTIKIISSNTVKSSTAKK